MLGGRGRMGPEELRALTWLPRGSADGMSDRLRASKRSCRESTYSLTSCKPMRRDGVHLRGGAPGSGGRREIGERMRAVIEGGAGARGAGHAAAWAAAMALLLLAAPAAAQNLLSNPDFDHDVSGWTFASSPVFDPALDVNGNPGSGSALIDSFPGTACQCVVRTVAAGETYEFGGSALLAASQDQVAAAVFFVKVFGDQVCHFPQVALFRSAVQGASPNQWVELRGQFALPAGFSGGSVLFCGFVGDGENTQQQGHLDHLFLDLARLGACVPGDASLCLYDQRFQVTATYRTASGQAGQARALPWTDRAGYLWFFSASNLELTVKVINGCGLNQSYWVFASGLTSVEVELTVTDTQTGASRTYSNPLNRSFQAIEDTAAFTTCP
jgi:hypothetical protein